MHSARELDPIDRLVADHRRFLGRLADFEGQIRSVASAPVGPGIPAIVASFAGFLHREVDQVHGRCEERGLFPVLARLILPGEGPIEVLVAEHETLRGHQQLLARSAVRLESDLEAVEAMTAVRETEREVRALLSDHIAKEDTILFPMARELLRPVDLLEVRAAFDEVDAAAGRSTDPPSPGLREP